MLHALHACNAACCRRASWRCRRVLGTRHVSSVRMLPPVSVPVPAAAQPAAAVQTPEACACGDHAARPAAPPRLRGDVVQCVAHVRVCDARGAAARYGAHARSSALDEGMRRTRLLVPLIDVASAPYCNQQCPLLLLAVPLIAISGSRARRGPGQPRPGATVKPVVLPLLSCHPWCYVVPHGNRHKNICVLPQRLQRALWRAHTAWVALLRTRRRHATGSVVVRDRAERRAMSTAVNQWRLLSYRC
jgi:hypothetical protein